MKACTRSAFRVHLFLIAALIATPTVYAQSGTWLGNGLNWDNTGAWVGGTIATGSGNTANFTGVDLTSDVSMALGANRTISNIIFTDAGTSSNNLTLTGNTLTLGTSSSINVTQPDRNLTISSILAGTAGFTKTGQGTLTLTGSNTITGATSISGGGRLVLDYSPNDNRKLPNNSTLSLAAGTIVLKGGIATENFTSTTFNTGNNGTFFVRDGGSAKINLNGFTVGTGSTVSFSHASMATTDRLNTIGILGAWFTVGDRWATNAGVGGAGGSAGAGAAADGDIVGYTGGATFTNALVTDNNTNADLSGGLVLSGSKTVNTLRIVSTADNQVLNIGANIISTSNLTGNGTSTSGGLLYAGGANGNYTITGTGSLRQFNQNGQGQLINVYSGTLTVDATVGSGTSPLVKTGEGTLVLNKAPSTGAIRVYQGVLRLTGAGNLITGSSVQNGAAIELGNSVAIGALALNITGTGVSNGGALRSVATTTSSYAGAITMGTGGARINSDSGTLTLTGGVVTASGNNVTFGGAGNTTVSTVAISGGGGLIKDGAGNTSLNVTNSYTGLTRIDNGTLTLGHATNTIVDTGAVNVNGGTLALGTNTDTVGAVTLTSGSITGSGTALQGVLTGTSYAFQSGSVSAKLGGSGVALTKTTGGTVTLSGTNTYTGGTNVNGGTLLINGDNSGATGAISVATGAYLGGTGSIGGNLTFAATSTFDIEDINDPLAVTGTVSFGSGFGIANLAGIDWDSLALNTPYTLISTSQTFTSSDIANFGSANAAPVGTGRSAYFQSGSLQLVVVPEPTTMAILGAGVAILGLTVARRRKA